MIAHNMPFCRRSRPDDLVAIVPPAMRNRHGEDQDGRQTVLFQPNADQVFAWKKTLPGPPDSFANLTQSTFTPELWFFTKS